MDICSFISSAEGARACFDGIEFPADKQEILHRLEKSGGSEAAIVAANRLPDKTYQNLDDLLEDLAKQP